MAEHMIIIGKKDHITAVPPMNGETDFLLIRYGQNADQIHIDRAVAEQLRDAIIQTLAELGEIEQAGPKKVQRERTALNIISSHHMAALPARTQQHIRKKLAGAATSSNTQE